MIRSRNRSQIEITYTVLTALTTNPHGVLKITNLMYHVGVNWAKIKQLVETLEKQGYVTTYDTSTASAKRRTMIVELTDKGREEARKWNTLTLKEII